MWSEAYMVARKGLGGPLEGVEVPPGGPQGSSRCPGRVGRPIRMSGRGHETLPLGREVSGGPPAEPGGSGGLPKGQERLGIPPRSPGGVGRHTQRSTRPTRKSRWGQVSHLEVQERSGNPPGGPGGVGRPTQKSGKGREAHADGREGSRRPPKGPGGFDGSTRRAERVR